MAEDGPDFSGWHDQSGCMQPNPEHWITTFTDTRKRPAEGQED